MAALFIKKRLVDPYIVAIDSTLLNAKGHVWHKSSMIKGIVPRSGIDTDAQIMPHSQIISKYKSNVTKS
jgi:hypothetical protein